MEQESQHLEKHTHSPIKMLHLTLVHQAGDFPQLLPSCVTASGELIYSHPKREVETQKRSGYIQFQFSESMGLLSFLTGKRIEYTSLKRNCIIKRSPRREWMRMFLRFVHSLRTAAHLGSGKKANSHE